MMVREAAKNNVTLYFMSKQINRNPIICKAVLDEGFRGVVAVEVQCARNLNRHHIRISHVGHLVQIPVHDIDYVLSMDPEVWTVYSVENAKAISDRAERMGKIQNLLIQPVGKGDLMFDSMTGGIPEEKIVEAAMKIGRFPGVKIVGTTSFLCMLYDLAINKVRPISNFHTVVRSARRVQEELGIEITQINTPGTTTRRR